MAVTEGAKYHVYVDDNFHHMDESQRYSAGIYDDCDTATEKCKEIVDTYLRNAYRQGMSATALLDTYTSFGEDPWIATSDKTCQFSAWRYAEYRCNELCGGGNKGER